MRLRLPWLSPILNSVELPGVRGILDFGILQLPEEQSRTVGLEPGCQSSSVEGQPQCPGLCHSSHPNARSLSHSVTQAWGNQIQGHLSLRILGLSIQYSVIAYPR